MTQKTIHEKLPQDMGNKEIRTREESSFSRDSSAKPDIPDNILAKWERIVNLTATLAGVPAGLIMKFHPSEIEIIVSSVTPGNPYKKGDRTDLNTGTYCRAVMEKRAKLLIPDARQDPEWDHNPGLKAGMVSYLGLPLLWPDGEIFGTICVLDNKENHYAVIYQKLLAEFREMMETDLQLILEAVEHKRIKEALQKAHDGLEIRVKERTVEIDRANEQLKFEIEERKRIEDVLKKSEKILSSTFHALYDLILVIDKDFRVVMSNWKDHDYISEAERQGNPFCYKCIMHRDTPCDFCHVAEVFASGNIKECEHTNEVDGKTREIRVFPVFDDNGAVVMVAEHVRDITERKRMEERLLRAQKTEAIGTLAAGLAHNFNNLLTNIQGNASLMLLDVDSIHPHFEMLKEIEKQVRSGAELTGQLLGYARRGRYEVKAIDLNQIVQEVSHTFGRARKEITIHLELEKDLSAIEVDQGQIEQVLLNLYMNGATAMPGGGMLFLKTMNVNHEDMLDRIHDPRPGSYILLSITDSGRGMDKETLERIFDPFFTTSEMGRGTGLGLASVYGIIKGHGGYIHVVSEKGRSTTFTIYLPASDKEVERNDATTEHIAQSNGSILLVDDEDIVLTVGTRMLKKMGYRVLRAKGGKEAVEIYKTNKDSIDMVILDMIMPDMGGGKVYDRIKEINPDVKVLLASGYSIEGQATEILERGCDGFIQKPFNISQLSEKVKKVSIL